MADRYPLIANPTTQKIEELAAYDNLNLTNSGIVSATTIQADQFVGNLAGTATTANNLYDAANITTGIVSTSRLSGTYGINITGTATTANNLSNAANISTGTIGTARLAGSYNIDVTGTATTANNLLNAANISSGFIDPARLTGVYNISITGNAANANANQIFVDNNQDNQTNYIVSIPVSSGLATALVDGNGLVYNPGLNRLGIGSTAPTQAVDVAGSISVSGNYFGTGETLAGIVTQITAGIGITLSPTNGKGKVTVTSFNPVGKTIFVNQNGDDANTGLAENNAKRTIKAATAIAFSGDTIKVTPGVYVENNPIVLGKGVGLEGLELRNCIVTPQNPGKDLFHVNNSVHITNFSFVGAASTNGASIIALQPLAGVASDRFFDAARMIRLNLDYIANEAVGYLTSTQYRNPAFQITGGISSCVSDIKSVFKAICYDITRGGNSKCVGAGKSYYTNVGALQHIVGVKTETIDAFRYAADIARAVVNNSTWGSNPTSFTKTVINAVYDNVTGIVTITSPNHGLAKNDAVKIAGLGFTCPSGPGIVTYPSGNLGYIFSVRNVVGVNTFEAIVGQSTLPHNYVSGGTVRKYQNFQNTFTQVKDLSMQIDPNTGFNNGINGCANVVSAIYSCVGVVTTIIDQGLSVLGVGINTTYPGNAGLGTTNPNDASFSPGVGPITQGPYIRNCTNFIPNSIGMKVDGFNAEPGDKDDVGVTGSMSVDSYTQYNQGGIGVSITNGAYAQLVSIFTICDDTAIFTGSGGQCDITNSNSSFGTYGLVSDGVGNETTKSIYRYTGNVISTAKAGTDTVVISGVGTNRPYQGQSLYFGKLYYTVDSIEVTNGGSGYTTPPTVTIDAPTGPNGIRAEASATISNGKIVSIDVVNSGSQYETVPNITFSSGSATAVAKLTPIYYSIDTATLPSSGISTVVLSTNLNNNVGLGTTAYFARTSLQLASSICFEHVGAGNDINKAKPALGGVVIPQNQVVKKNGGQLVYTSTDQSGNFRIGDGVIINQNTGSISGRAFSQSLLNTVTPLIIALSR